jgi:hypothetical protein
MGSTTLNLLLARTSGMLSKIWRYLRSPRCVRRICACSSSATLWQSRLQLWNWTNWSTSCLAVILAISAGDSDKVGCRDSVEFREDRRAASSSSASMSRPATSSNCASSSCSCRSPSAYCRISYGPCKYCWRITSASSRIGCMSKELAADKALDADLVVCRLANGGVGGVEDAGLSRGAAGARIGKESVCLGLFKAGCCDCEGPV